MKTCQKGFGKAEKIDMSKLHTTTMKANQDRCGLNRANKNAFVFKKYTLPAAMLAAARYKTHTIYAKKHIGTKNAQVAKVTKPLCSPPCQQICGSYSTIVQIPLGLR